MDSRLYMHRAENEIKLAGIIFTISENQKLQREVFHIKDQETYYSAVISHSYYCMFYAAKAYLAKKGIETESPEEHKKTYEEFAKFVGRGIIDGELLNIYKKIMVRADTLLLIFRKEKKKRGDFTYQKLPQANKEPARESIENAKTFFRNIFNIVGI